MSNEETDSVVAQNEQLSTVETGVEETQLRVVESEEDEISQTDSDDLLGKNVAKTQGNGDDDDDDDFGEHGGQEPLQLKNNDNDNDNDDDDDDVDNEWNEPGNDKVETSTDEPEKSFQELYPMLVSIEEQSNEFPDCIESYEDVRRYEEERKETSRRKSTPLARNRLSASVRIGRATEDAALLEESYEVIFGKWPVLHRHESPYVRVPPPEFFLPSEDIDMSGFMRPFRDSTASLSDNLASATDSDLQSANPTLLSAALNSHRMSSDALGSDWLSTSAPPAASEHLKFPGSLSIPSHQSNRRSTTISSLSELSAATSQPFGDGTSTLPRLSVTTMQENDSMFPPIPPAPPLPNTLGKSDKKRRGSENRNSIILPNYKHIPVNAFEVGASAGAHARTSKKKAKVGTLFGKSNRSTGGSGSSLTVPHENMSSISSTSTSTSSSSSTTYGHNKQRSEGWIDTTQRTVASSASTPKEQPWNRKSFVDQILSHELKEADLDKVKLFNIDSQIRSDLICGDGAMDRLISVHEPRPRFSETGSSSGDAVRQTSFSPYPDTRFIYSLIKFTSLKFTNGPIEPLFCRMALYDAANQSKISESFGFYVNDSASKRSLSTQMQQRMNDAMKNAIYDEPTALFRVQEANPDIYVVMWFDRLLQGSTDDVVKYYRDNAKGLDKQIQKSTEICRKMGHVRQPFLWGFFKLFYRPTESTIGVNEGTRTVRRLHLIPSSCNASSPFDILSILMDPEHHELTRDKNSIECTLRFEVNHASPDKLQEFSIHYNNQSRIHKPSQKRELPPIKSRGRYGFDSHIQRYFNLVNDFPVYVPTTPNLVFRNALYVYPDFAEIMGLKSKNVNAFLRVSFRESDAMITGDETPRIVDPYDSTQMRSAILTSTSYHQKCPQFFDEIKVALPVHPSPTSNILIEIFVVKTPKLSSSSTFSHGTPVSLDIATDFGNAQVTRVGYSFLTIFDDNAFKGDGAHTLPVYKKLVDNYVSNSDHMEKAPKMSVTLRTRHASSIYPKDPNACKFLHACNRFYDFFQFYEDPNVGEEHLRSVTFFSKLEDLMMTCGNSLRELKEANYIELIQYVPVILNVIIKTSAKLMMLYPSEESANNEQSDDELRLNIILRQETPKLVRVLFDMMLFFQSNLVSVTKEKGRKNSHMSRYVQYFFTNMTALHVPSYMCLLNQWIQFLEDHKDKSNDQFNPAFDWFANEVISGKAWARMSIAENQQQPIFLNQLQVSKGETFRPDTLCSMDSIRFTWFFTDIILKSLYMYTQMDEFQQKNSRFNREYVEKDVQLKDCLQKLLSLIVPALIEGIDKRYSHLYLKNVTLEANQELAMFFREMLPIMGVSFVRELVKHYLQTITASTPSQYPRTFLKLEFLDIFCRHGSIIHMIQHEGFEFIVEEMVDCVITGAMDDADDLRVLALKTIKQHLLKQDYDANLQDKRQLIADMYMPLACGIFEYHKSIIENASKSGLLLDLLVIVFHILRNASPEKVTALFISESDQFNLSPITKEGDSFISALHSTMITTIILLRRYDDKKLVMCMSRIVLELFDQVIVKQYLEPNMDEHVGIHEELKRLKLEKIEKEEERKRREKELRAQISAGSVGTVLKRRKSSLKDIRLGTNDNTNGVDEQQQQQQSNESEEMEEAVLEEKNRRLDHFIDVFEHSCNFLLNLGLNTPRMDTMTTQILLDGTVFPFIQSFKPLFSTSVERRESNKDGMQSFVDTEDSNRLSSGWDTLVGGLLLQYGLPADYRSHPSLVRCVRALLSVYIHDLKYNTVENDDDEAATARDDLDSDSDSDTESESLLLLGDQRLAKDEDAAAAAAAAANNGTSMEVLADSTQAGIGTDEQQTSIDTSNDKFSQDAQEEHDKELLTDQEKDSGNDTTSKESEIGEEDEIEYAPNGTTIVGGTLHKLVERLFSDDKSHPPFHHIFFLTYLSFSDPYEVLDAMKDCSEKLINATAIDATGAEKMAREKRIIRFMQVLKHWIKDHYSDLDASFVAHLIHFMDNGFARTVYKFKGDRTQQLLHPIQRILAKQLVSVEQLKLTYQNKNLPPTKIPRSFTQAMINNAVPAEFNLLEWDSMEVARQMTLIDFGLYKSIHHKELFGKARTGDKRHITAPNVTAISDRFNNMSSWIYSTIMRIEEVESRAEVMKKIVEVAEKLRQLNNFNGLNYMLSGMENNAVHRLKKTWALIPDHETRFKSLKKIMAHPYDEYRRALDQAVPPCCPFLGVALTDFTFIDETSDFLMPNNARKLKLINMHKRNLYVRGIELIKQKQQKPYEFKVIPFLIKAMSMDIFIDNMDSDEAWDRSVELEPQVGGFMY